MSVSLLFVNKRSVSWSFVCQFIIDMLFATSDNVTEQFVKFHHYTIGPHESMGCMLLARLGYMFSSPLYTCVHYISRITDPSSCLHTCTLWRPQWNVYLIDQRRDREWLSALMKNGGDFVKSALCGLKITYDISFLERQCA